MIMSDYWIEEQSISNSMISPFAPSQIKKIVSEKIISYGLSSYGYDIRVDRTFKIFTNINNSIIDPKNFSLKSFINVEGDNCIIPPNSFILAKSIEYIKLPRDILVLCVGKSTYARCGIIVNVTPLEPQWEGHITLEISNTTPLPAKIYASEGICQLIFLKGDQECRTSYSDRKGKYMFQNKITLPRA